jgi:hypothetical protein
MARKKKEAVSVDEVRDEMENAPMEGEAEAVAEDPAVEEGAPEVVDSGEETTDEESEEGQDESTLHLRVEVCDPQDSIKEVKDAMNLRVRLSDEELVEYSDEMIEAMDDAKRARSRLKGYQAECKQEEEEALQRVEEAKAKLRSKHEDKRVEVLQIHNFTRGKVYAIRLDTDEVVQERALQPWERQSDITEVTGDEAETESDLDPEPDEGAEAQADSEGTDDTEDLNFDDESEVDGDLVGVGAGSGEEEIEIED